MLIFLSRTPSDPCKSSFGLSLYVGEELLFAGYTSETFLDNAKLCSVHAPPPSLFMSFVFQRLLHWLTLSFFFSLSFFYGNQKPR